MRQSSVKIIFFGTSEFAVPALEVLKNEGYEIAAVVTNPDEPVGRKKVLTPPPVKVAAEKLGLDILQPNSLKNNPEFIQILNTRYQIQDTDVGIIAAYGKIIPAEIINLFPFGILNIHPSLLPKYRGPTPIQTTILNGEDETGVTIIKIDEEVDHGPVVAESGKCEAQDKTHTELTDELAKLGAELLIKTLPNYLAGKITLHPQDHLRATFTKKFTRDDAKIDWNKTAEEIDRQIRALNPEPGTWTLWDGKVLKILEASVQTPTTSGHDRGQMWWAGRVSLENGEATIGTISNGIVPKVVQLEGKKPMSTENFIRGNQDFVGAVLE